jgi:hypothetical protein
MLGSVCARWLANTARSDAEPGMLASCTTYQRLCVLMMFVLLLLPHVGRAPSAVCTASTAYHYAVLA